MKVKNTSFISTMTTYMAVMVLGTTLIGCSHDVAKKTGPKVTPVAMSTLSAPAEEMNTQKTMFEQAYLSHVDVLASSHFDEAKRFFERAGQDNKKGASAETILKSLSFSKAHLHKATEIAGASEAKVSEVIHARAQALKAGAANHPEMLKPLDNKLKGMTAAREINPNDKIALQNQYLAVELSTIKSAKLNHTKELLDQAKVKNAEKVTPQAYGQAISKFNIADKLIETDRHNDVKINQAVAEADKAATRVISLLVSEQTSRNQTPEQRAMTLESRDNALLDAGSAMNVANAGSMRKDMLIAKQGENLAASESQNKEHERKQSDDKVVSDAAAKFNSDEADVYRQDGLLIIRLKSMNFASGRSDLPSESISVLNKVKEVIKNIAPSQVTVQGHTDAVGGASNNQKLSQTRAQSVEKFFTVDSGLENSQFDSIGYGYSKPLASNKTKEGRAQNRRVDIVMKTTPQI